MSEVLQTAVARKVLRVLEHHIKEVKYRQTGSDPKNNGYEYIEMPLWSARQCVDELRSVLSPYTPNE